MGVIPDLSARVRALGWATLVANCVLVVTGGAVRLTDSGLGCPTWPRCTERSYTPHGEYDLHSAIEFGNRMLTFVLVAVAVACWVAALVVLVRSWHGDRSWAPFVLATVIALGIPAQAIIGGITVLTDLNPWIVALHLLVSMAMIGLCVWLVHTQRALSTGPATVSVRRLAWLVLAAGWVVLYLGTVVTGSGPHAGDEDARRTGLDPQVFSHLHAIAVYLLVALTVGLLALGIRTGNEGVRRAAATLLLLEVAQGVVGFVQYFNDLPVGLVIVHMLGAALTAAGLAWNGLAARR